MEETTSQLVDHIKAAGKMNDAGNSRVLTKADYFTAGSSLFGLSKKQISSTSDYNNALCDAGIRVAADDLAERVKAKKAAGEDPSDLKSEVRMPIHGGRIVASVDAVRSHNNPRDTSKKIVNMGSARIAFRMGSAVTTDAASYARDLISDLLD